LGDNCSSRAEGGLDYADWMAGRRRHATRGSISVSHTQRKGSEGAELQQEDALAWHRACVMRVSHRAKILADRLIGTPAAFVFNGIARVLGAILRRNHAIESSNVKHIVVAKLVGMGSILQASPLLKSLRAHFPDAKLTFVTLRSNSDLVNRLGCVDEVLTLDDRSVSALALSTMKTVAILIRRRADIYFDLEVYSAFASLLALWAVTRNRIGFYRRSVAFKHGIYTHLVYFNTRMPVRQLYLQLGRVAGVPSGQPELTGPIRIDENDRLGAARVLAQLSGWRVGQPYVVMNPNASDLLLERR